MKRIESLQALRGLGALAIMGYHYRYFVQPGDKGIRQLLDTILSKSIIGVDLFFVLSGFIIIITTSKTQQGVLSSFRFLFNRALRIVPMYYIGLSLALIALALDKPHEGDSIKNLISAVTFTVYEVGTAPNYIPFSSAYNIRWTLNYELYFYLIFSISILLRFRLLWVILMMAAPVILTPFIYGHDFSINTRNHVLHSASISFISNPIMLEFLLGCISGVIYLKVNKTLRGRNNLLFFITSLLLFLSLLIMLSTNLLIPLSIGAGIMISLIILFLSLSENISSRFSPRFLIRLGDISFSFYLFHMSICTLIFSFMWRSGFRSSEFIDSGVCLVAFAATFYLSSLSHKHLEGLTRKIMASRKGASS